MSIQACPQGLPRTTDAPAFGDLVIARAWKFNGAPHWVVPGLALGADEHGQWIYQPKGSLVSRPGRAHLASCPALCLIPHTGSWVGTFYDDPGEQIDLYLDVSTQIGWQELPTGGREVNSIDMDLDVIRDRARGVFLDDEDEFIAHARSMDYPQALQTTLRATADALLERVAADGPPFSKEFRRQWLDRADQLPTRP